MLNAPQPKENEIRRAREIIMRYGWNTMAYQILNPGISLWFSSRHEAVIGFVNTRTHIIVAGSPVADETIIDDVVVEFFLYVVSTGKRICFFGAQERIAAILRKRSPISSILLGAQPVWTPEEFLTVLQSKQSLRAQLHRAVNKGVTASVLGSEDIRRNGAVIDAELRRVLKEWIATRRLPPMHFLVEPDTLGNLDDRVVVVAQHNGRMTGYCIASPIPLRRGWLIEQIIRGNGAQNGTAELLLERMVVHLHESGAEMVTLGLSPLSQHYASPFRHPFWLNAFLTGVRIYGSSFYHFDGLDAFKSKFNPTEWEPVYAVTNEKKSTLSTLYAIATAFAGTSPIRFIVKGIFNGR
ncbi:MAG: phosphatidylglycerol lysyltransferase domain-containing protein [Bacteroidota bacterium]